MDERKLQANSEELPAEDSPEESIISAILLFQKTINNAYLLINKTQEPDLDALLKLTAAAGSEEYARFKTDLSYREKLDYLLDIVLYQILQNEIDSTVANQNKEIKAELIKMMSDLPKSQQIPIDPKNTIKVGLQQRGFQHSADTEKLL